MTNKSGIPVSVLDVVPVFEGSSATQALRDTVAIAPGVEEAGYLRYWVAEHHSTPSLATSSPGTLAGQLAAVTSTIRVGSGGVLLPNHAPLVVAEQFGTLEALYPGRIDLGLGRAPGTDPMTARALRRAPTAGDGDFQGQITELRGYFGTGIAGEGIVAVPAADAGPDVWLLGSSPSSAELAGRLGLPYAFAHQINPYGTVEALGRYRATFRPSPQLDRPRTLVAALAMVADSDEAAWKLAAPYLLGKIRMRMVRRFDAFPSQEAADAYPYSAEERKALEDFAAPQFIGGRQTVQARLADLVERSGADEIMALTVVPDQEARLRSFTLFAEAASAVRPGNAEDVSALL